MTCKMIGGRPYHAEPIYPNRNYLFDLLNSTIFLPFFETTRILGSVRRRRVIGKFSVT